MSYGLGGQISDFPSMRARYLSKNLLLYSQGAPSLKFYANLDILWDIDWGKLQLSIFLEHLFGGKCSPYSDHAIRKPVFQRR